MRRVSVYIEPQKMSVLLFTITSVVYTFLPRPTREVGSPEYALTLKKLQLQLTSNYSHKVPYVRSFIPFILQYFVIPWAGRWSIMEYCTCSVTVNIRILQNCSLARNETNPHADSILTDMLLFPWEIARLQAYNDNSRDKDLNIMYRFPDSNK